MVRDRLRQSFRGFSTFEHEVRVSFASSVLRLLACTSTGEGHFVPRLRATLSGMPNGSACPAGWPGASVRSRPRPYYARDVYDGRTDRHDVHFTEGCLCTG